MILKSIATGAAAVALILAGSTPAFADDDDQIFTPPNAPAVPDVGGLVSSVVPSAAALPSLPSAPAVPTLPSVPKPTNRNLPALPTVPTPGIPALPNAGTVPNLARTMTTPSDASDNASFTLSPNGSSGISATVTVRGLKVTGKAKGLDPDKRYISLYYGSMSTPQAGQTLTCADLRTAALTQQWGLDPEWTVRSDGTGTLNVTAPRRLSDGVYTMSIREVPDIAGSDPYVGFNPVTYPVRACGATR